MTENSITIVITSFRSDKKIINCLNSVSSKYKVIVIENSNNFSIKTKLEDQYENVTCILAGENLGYAKANNLGLSKVKTNYALILNPDTIINENTIEKFFDVTKKIDDFAIIAPAAQDEKNDDNNCKRFVEVESVKGFAMFLKLSEFNDIGFFDDNFFIYLEEIDLCRRLKKKNKKIFLDPAIKIYHQGGSSHDEIYNFEMELSRNWHWMWSTFYFKKKYNGYFFALNSVLRKLVSSIIKYFFYSIVYNKRKKLIYKYRLSGLFNSILGKPSWYRPFNKY